MKITIAKTAGFCMGVRRAVDMVLDASNTAGEPIYTYGPLIHNPQVLEMLENKKIYRLDTIPEKGEGVVLIRAHGVPPEDEQALEQAGFTVINATCPRVVRVQVIINRYAKKGYATIIIGDKKHPEVVGLLGYARGKGHTVTSMEQLEALPEFDTAVVVAQTTQNTQFYDQIKAWCEKNRPQYKLFDTICGSTEKRQNEVRTLAQSHDAVIVVGGKQSGNTKRLAQVARETGAMATHIEEAHEIDYDALDTAKSIAITAGASTPNWIINDTCLQVDQTLQAKRPVVGALLKGLNFLLLTNVLLAAGAAGLTYGAALIQGSTATATHAAIALFYVLSMHIMNNLLTIGSDTYNKPDRAAFYRRHGLALKTASFFCAVAGLYLAFKVGMLSFVLLLVMSLLGYSYNLKVLPSRLGAGKMHKLKDLPGSKTLFTAIAWGSVTSILPAISGVHGVVPALTAFLFTTAMVFARTAFSDIQAIQGDRIAGKETLPILVGEKKSLTYVQWALTCAAVLPLVCLLPVGVPVWALGLIFIPLLMQAFIKVYQKKNHLSGSPFEFLFESIFLLAGLAAFVV